MIKTLISAAMVAAVVFAATLLANDPAREQKLQQAIDLLESKGEVAKAAALFEDVAKSSDRTLAARALLYLAQAQERQSTEQARKTYDRIIKEFGGQTEAVADARMRRAALPSSARNAGLVTRRVWTLSPNQGMDFGAVSRDGRYIPFYDDAVNEELFLHDLTTGADRRVTNGASFRPGMPKSEHQYAAEWSFSRDGKQLTYNWFIGWKNSYELRVIDLQGAGIPQFRLLLDNPEVQVIEPQDWSPDGKWIAAWLSRRDSSRQIGLVSVRDGSWRVLKSVDGKPLRMFFSPDGKYLAYDLAARDTSGQRDIFILATDASSESAAVVPPSDNQLAGWSPDGTRLLFTSARSGSRDLWALGFSGGKTRGSPELIKRDMLGFSLGITASGSLYTKEFDFGLQSDIQVASFDFAKGQFLSTPSPVVSTLVGSSAPDWSPDGKYLAYVSGRLGSAVIGIRTLETGQVRELSSGLYGLQSLGWAPDGGSFIATGRDSKLVQGIYRIDAKIGQSSLVVSRSNVASPVLSPDGKTLYYAQRIDLPGATELTVVKRELATATEIELLRRPALWPAFGALNLSPDGRYIAAAISDPSTKSNTFLIIPTAGGEPTEVIRRAQPQQPGMFVWGPDSRSLLIRIPSGGKFELWHAFVDGTQAVKLDTTVDGNVGSGRLHPDGRQIAFQVSTRTPMGYEIWVTENFLPTTKK